MKPNLESGTLMASGSHHRQKGTGSSTSSSSSTTNSSSSLPTTHVLETAFPAISHREIDAFCSSVLSRERNHNSDYAPSTEYKGSQSRDLEASMEVDESRNESPMSNASDCMQDMFETGSVGAINANMLDDLFPSSMEMHSIMNDLKDKQLPTRLTSIIKSKPNPRKSSSIN